MVWSRVIRRGGGFWHVEVASSRPDNGKSRPLHGSARRFPSRPCRTRLQMWSTSAGKSIGGMVREIPLAVGFKFRIEHADTE